MRQKLLAPVMVNWQTYNSGTDKRFLQLRWPLQTYNLWHARKMLPHCDEMLSSAVVFKGFLFKNWHSDHMHYVSLSNMFGQHSVI
jgi:hypothetical protein